MSRLFDRMMSMPPIWIVLWIGTIVLSIGLVVLSRTRWGQSRPLRKCAVLSLLAHVLLGCLASTVQIVTGVAGAADTPAVRVSIVHGPQSPEDRQEQSKPKTPQPWATVTTDDHPIPETGNLERSDQDAPTDIDLPNTDPAPGVPDQVLDTTNAVSASNDPDAVVSDPEQARSETTASPEPIEQPTAQRSEPPDLADMLAAPELQRATDTALPNVGEQSLPTRPIAQSIERVMPQPRPAASDDEAGDPLLESDSAADDSRGASPVPPQDPTVIADNGGGRSRPRVKPIPASNSASASGNRGNQGDDSEASRSSDKPGHKQSDIYRDRTSQDRDDLVTARGGSGDTEAAVRAALRWLAANQAGDGKWSASQHGGGRDRFVAGEDRRGAGLRADTGITGLAVLAYLGAGHTHLRGGHQETVRRGLEYLLRQQQPNGNLAGNATIFARMYCHAMAMFALSEAYAMTGDDRLRRAVERAVHYSVSAQDVSTGGWRYKPGDEGDTSQLGWQVMALRSASLAGVEVPDETWHRVRRFLRSVSSGTHGGLASYQPGHRPSRVMTAEALVCRQLTETAANRRVHQEAVDFVLEELPDAQSVNLYYWYYATLGLFQHQGSGWERWNRELASALVQRQETTGSLAGSWSPDTVWGGAGGRVYSTALGAMSLEVYYRYARSGETHRGP